MAEQPHPDIALFEKRYGQLGGVERRTVDLGVPELKETGEGGYSVSGYASVFDSRSLDLGGFVEEIAPGAFDDVLSRSPDVHLLWDHDTSRVLARTKNNTLKLGSDGIGLPYWARVAPTSYAADLKVLLDRGDVNQASFAFTVGDQEWDTRDDHGAEIVVRTINRVADLYDVTITAQGAYPAATSEVARMFVRSYAGIQEEQELEEAVEQPNQRLALAKSRARARARIAGGQVRTARCRLNQ
jgi:uncharacterized protein